MLRRYGTIRHEGKVRARSYLKVRYAIGDISMPNISHKAAPRLPVILNIIYARSYKDSGAWLPGACSPHDDARRVVCVFHTSTYHATINRRRGARTPPSAWNTKNGQSKNNIDPLFRPSNKYRKYRSTELQAQSRSQISRPAAVCYVVNSPLRRTSASAADDSLRFAWRRGISAFDSPPRKSFGPCFSQFSGQN